MARRFGFVHNPRAGRGDHRAPIQQAMENLRAAGHEVREYDCAGDPCNPAAAALGDECDVVVACGGDGTVSGVAGAIWNSAAVLGVFPVGTLNHFAKDIGIPDAETAERVLLEGAVRNVDAASLNGRLFINNSGIGIYPAIVSHREEGMKRGLSKWAAFTVACFRTLMRATTYRLHLDVYRLRVDADGERHTCDTRFLFVGNNVYETAAFAIGSRKTLDAGTLGIFTAKHAGRFGLVRIVFHALRGTIGDNRDLSFMTAKKLRVRTKRARIRVSLDGEVHRMNLPLEYAILPGALRVLAP